MIEIRRKFRMSKGFKTVDPLDGYVFTPESNAHRFIVECVDLVDGQETVVPFEAGSTVHARFLKADHVTELVDGSLDTDGAAVVTLPAECYAVPGRFLLTILVTTGSTKICVFAGAGTVLEADSTDVNISSNTARSVDQKIAEIDNATDAAEAAVSQVNSAISAGSAKITEINQAAAAARASIPQDYTALSDSVGDLKSATENEIVFAGGNIIPLYGYDYQGKYLDANGVPQTGNAWAITAKVPLVVGETYTYSGISYTANNARCFFYSVSDDVVGNAFYLNTSGGEITVPENVSYARFTVCRTEGDTTTFSLSKKYGTLKNYVEIVSNDFSNVANGLYANNLYNSSGNVQGYLDDTATIVPGNAWRVTALIPVVPGFSYIYNGITMSVENRSNCFFYDTKGQPIVSTAFLPVANDYGVLNVPIGAYYVRFTLNNQAGDQNTFAIRLFVRQTECTSVVTVSPDGTKDYRTINEAYAYAYTIQSKEHPVTILIYPGTYNEVLECTPANDSPYVWGAYISFVGVNQKDVVWRNDSGLYKNSPLHTSNPCLIKNITFIATHDDDQTFESTYADYTADNQQNYGAYGLHLDDPSNRTDLTGEEYETIVEDCTIISKQHAAIGAGMRAGQTLIIRNCRLLMEIPDALRNAIDSTKGALLFHRILGTSDTFIQNLVVDTCNIETNMDKAIYTYGSGGGFKVDFIRNFVWSEIGGAANDIIRGPVSMITTKSYGNNVAALNKTTI